MFLVVKEMRLKGLVDKHFLDKSVAENSDYDEEDNVFNHGRKSHTHQNPLYETQARRDFVGKFQPNKYFSQ